MATPSAFRHEIARATIEDALPPTAGWRCIARPWLPWPVAATRRGSPTMPRQPTTGRRWSSTAPAPLSRRPQLGAHREAAAHYAAVLRHTEALPPGERAALLGKRSFECFLAGMLPESLAARELSLAEHRRAGDRLGEGDDERWLSRLHWYLGDGTGFRECAARAVAILAELPPGPELAMAYSSRAAPPMFDYDLAETAEWGGRALRLAEELGEHEVLIATIRNMGTVELSHGLAEGADKVHRSLDLALEAGMQDHVGVAYSNLVSSSLTTHDYDTAGTYLAAGRAFCDEHDLRSWGTYLDAWGARFALDQAQWADATQLVKQVLERAPRSLPHSRFVALLVRGVLAARMARATRGPTSTRRWPSPGAPTSCRGSAPLPWPGQRLIG